MIHASRVKPMEWRFSFGLCNLSRGRHLGTSTRICPSRRRVLLTQCGPPSRVNFIAFPARFIRLQYITKARDIGPNNQVWCKSLPLGSGTFLRGEASVRHPNRAKADSIRHFLNRSGPCARALDFGKRPGYRNELSQHHAPTPYGIY